jgi:hypothetical protein
VYFVASCIHPRGAYGLDQNDPRPGAHGRVSRRRGDDRSHERVPALVELAPNYSSGSLTTAGSSCRSSSFVFLVLVIIIVVRVARRQYVACDGDQQSENVVGDAWGHMSAALGCLDIHRRMLAREHSVGKASPHSKRSSRWAKMQAEQSARGLADFALRSDDGR